MDLIKKDIIKQAFLGIGLILSMLFSSTIVLDYSYIPRLLIFSIFLLIVLVYWLFRKSNNTIPLNIYTILSGLVVLYSLVSSLLLFNLSYSVIDLSKNTLFYLLFLFYLKYLQENPAKFYLLLLKTVIVIFFLSSFSIIAELLNLKAYDRHSLYTLSTISGHKNLYSSFVYLLSIFTIYSFFYFKNYWKWIALFAIIFQFSIIFILESRAVWFAYLVLLIIFVVLYFLPKKEKLKSRKNKILTIIGIVLSINLFFLVLLPYSVDAYLQNAQLEYNAEEISDLSTLTERFLVWEKTFLLINDNLMTGVGIGKWSVEQLAYSLPEVYRIQDLNVTFQRPHNDFLWVLSEYGLIGFNLMLFFIVSLLVNMYLVIRRETGNLNILLLAGLTGYIVISFFSFPKERIEHNILIILLLSFIIDAIRQTDLALSKQIRLSRITKISALSVVILIVYVVLLNFKGEYFTKKMYAHNSPKDYKAQIEYCNKATSFFYTKDPMSIPLEWYKGTAYANSERFPEANASFNKAYKINPYSSNILNDLASSLFMQEKIDSAIYFYKESIRINPRFDDPKLNLVFIYINQENYIEAERWNESIFHDSDRRSQYRAFINANK